MARPIESEGARAEIRTGTVGYYRRSRAVVLLQPVVLLLRLCALVVVLFGGLGLVELLQADTFGMKGRQVLELVGVWLLVVGALAGALLGLGEILLVLDRIEKK